MMVLLLMNTSLIVTLWLYCSDLVCLHFCFDTYLFGLLSIFPFRLYYPFALATCYVFFPWPFIDNKEEGTFVCNFCLDLLIECRLDCILVNLSSCKPYLIIVVLLHTD